MLFSCLTEVSLRQSGFLHGRDSGSCAEADRKHESGTYWNRASEGHCTRPLVRKLALDFNCFKHTAILDHLLESLGDLPFACIDSADTAMVPWLAVLVFTFLATRLGSDYGSNGLLSLLPFAYRAHC